jgi:hypothetical protein
MNDDYASLNESLHVSCPAMDWASSAARFVAGSTVGGAPCTYGIASRIYYIEQPEPRDAADHCPRAATTFVFNR